MNNHFTCAKALCIILVLALSCALTGFTPNASRRELVIATDDARQLRAVAQRFNDENDSYRVVIREIDGDATAEELSALAGAGGADMAAIYVEPLGGLPSEGLENLLPELMKDETEGAEPLVPSVLAAMTEDESVRWVCPSFMIHTYTADADIVGDRTSISLAEAQSLAASLGEDYTVFESWRGRENLMKDLTYAAGLYNEADYDAAAAELEAYPPFLNREDGPALLHYSPLWNAQSAGSLYYKWDGDYSYAGFPTSTGSGGYFEGVGANYAILKSGENKAGAWEFIRFALALKDETDTCFPILHSRFDEALQTALQNGALRQEDADKLLTLMDAITEYKP